MSLGISAFNLFTGKQIIWHTHEWYLNQDQNWLNVITCSRTDLSGISAKICCTNVLLVLCQNSVLILFWQYECNLKGLFWSRGYCKYNVILIGYGKVQILIPVSVSTQTFSLAFDS